MECPICFELIQNSTICPCVHHFCYKCIIDWCKINNLCPVCKEVITELKRDPQFDSINNNTVSIFKNMNEISIPIPNNTFPGVSLKNNIEGTGVKISKVNYNDQFYKYGIDKDDIILFINNVPCINHEQSINIINFLTSSNKNIKLTLLKKLKV